jgi:hypothetical protein
MERGRRECQLCGHVRRHGMKKNAGGEGEGWTGWQRSHGTRSTSEGQPAQVFSNKPPASFFFLGLEGKQSTSSRTGVGCGIV